MALFSFPWTSTNGDRVINSDQQRALHSSLFGYGVLTDFAGNVSGSTLSITAGSAIINGAYFDVGSTPETVNLSALSGTVRIILRFSLSARAITIEAIPSSQALEKSAATFELPIALVTKTDVWGQPTFSYEVAGTLADPVGSYKSFAASAVPKSHLVANGQAVSRVVYARLFDKIGTSYGAGDGSTTFNLPDRRGRVGVGLSSGDADFGQLANTGGAKTHQLTEAQLPSHKHQVTTRTLQAQSGTNFSALATNASGSTGHDTFTTGDNQPHNNLQPYGVEVVCIRA